MANKKLPGGRRPAGGVSTSSKKQVSVKAGAAGVAISELPPAEKLNGDELFPVVQDKETRSATTEKIKNIFPISMSEVAPETDLNTVTEPGMYLLNNPLYYDDQHHPFASYEGTKVLMIVSKVVKGRGTIQYFLITQTYFAVWAEPGGMYVRTSDGTKWDRWRQLTAS
ncbi:hypothetical protein NTH60_000916 [Enterobacter ludwigii]|nr:hypothetical protein [Enterobacter ludwigii]